MVSGEVPIHCFSCPRWLLCRILWYQLDKDATKRNDRRYGRTGSYILGKGQEDDGRYDEGCKQLCYQYDL